MKLNSVRRERGRVRPAATFGILLLVLAVLPACGGGGGGGSGEPAFDPNTGYDDVSLVLLTDRLDYGTLLIGEVYDQQIRVLNQSSVSAVTIERCDLPSADFQVVGDPFPKSLPAGEVTEFTVRFSPTREGSLDGMIVLQRRAPGVPFTIQVAAAARILGEDQVIDFGSQSLDTGGRTALLTIDLPPDAVSFAIEGYSGSQNFLELDTLTGPGGKVFENAQTTGPYQWGWKVYNPGTAGWDVEAFLTAVPNSDDPNVQLVPGGGTYSFRLRRAIGAATTMRVRAFIKRRAPEVANQGILDLNIFLVEGLSVNATTAPLLDTFQTSISRLDTLLRTVGIRLGDISYFDLKGDTWTDLDSYNEFRMLVRQSSAAPRERVNIFMVRDFPGTVMSGIAAGIPGSKLKGTTASGLACKVMPSNSALQGLVMAHEIGHLLGLWHTWDSNGSFDLLSDTSADIYAQGNLMLGLYFGPGVEFGKTLSTGQGMVMRSHPFVRLDPEAASPSPPTLRLPLSEEERQALKFLPAGWCGACSAEGR